MLRSTFLLVLAVFAVVRCDLSNAAENDPANDPVILLAMMKVATGGNNWDKLQSRHTVWRMSAVGLTGAAEQWDDLMTGRSYGHFKLGLISGGQGYDGKVFWTQDESGQSRTESSRDAVEASISAAYRTSMALWFPKRHEGTVEYLRDEARGDDRYYVLRITPQGGRPYDLWVNRKTNLVEQLAEREASATRIETYSDYRDVGNVRVPYAVLISRGDSRYDQLFALDRIEFDTPLDNAAFSQPAHGSVDYTFPAGQASVDVPLRILNGHIYVLAKLNGQGPFLLLLNSGGGNVLQADIARTLALKVEGSISGSTGLPNTSVGITKVDRVEIGGIEVRDQLFSTADLNDFGKRVEGIDAFAGLVGYELFRRFPVTINYDRSMATFYNPATFKYAGNGVRVPFRLDDHRPEVDGAIDGLQAAFAIDIGSAASVDLRGDFVQANDLVTKFGSSKRVVSEAGSSGRRYSLIARAGNVTFGDVSIAKPVTFLAQTSGDSSAKVAFAGTLGYGVLKQFNITYDYPGGQMFLEKSASFGRPDVADRSGLWIERTAAGYEVINVVDGGPGDAAGLTSGDIIRAIDGKSIETWSLADARTRFKAAPGTRIKLTLEGPRPRQVELVLGELI
jgi:PDZ domain